MEVIDDTMSAQSKLPLVGVPLGSLMRVELVPGANLDPKTEKALNDRLDQRQRNWYKAMVENREDQLFA